jgi:glycosyltransferase involved in cell wall biosynthesis
VGFGYSVSAGESTQHSLFSPAEITSMTLQILSHNEPAESAIYPPLTKRLLLISYHFPPVGGAGVQRPLKFVKYLRRYGWDVSVLVAANPSVPVFDESLCRDLPQDLVIEKARTWEPDYQTKQQLAGKASAAGTQASRKGLVAGIKGLAKRTVKGIANTLLQPDQQMLWLPNALGAAKRLLKRLPHQAILATAPPYSNLILGSILKRKTGLPLVVDYRDEWDLSSQYLENSKRDWFSCLVQERMQRSVLRRADAIIATTQGSTARLQERARQAGSRAPAFCIFNGFDDDDFSYLPAITSATQTERSRFRLVYTGTLWNLTTVEPLVRAIERLHADMPELLERLELVFVGRKTPEQIAILNRIATTRCQIVLRDYCDHSEALGLMADADALCLLLSGVPGAERVAPAKLFEYLALRKPILAITPEGETAAIVRRYFPQNQFEPTNDSGIANWLSERLVEFPGTGRDDLESTPPADLSEFTRQHQAGQLAEVLNGII